MAAPKRKQTTKQVIDQRRKTRILQFNQLVDDFASMQMQNESLVAKMWDFSTTHTALVFRLYCPSTENSIYLVCIATIQVNCCWRWENAQIEAREKDGLCEIFDIKGGLKVLCHDVDVIERETYLG